VDLSARASVAEIICYDGIKPLGSFKEPLRRGIGRSIGLGCDGSMLKADPGKTRLFCEGFEDDP
jgi:hypothetical protein